MARWKWFARPDEPIDRVGPATRYLGGRGSWAPGAGPEVPATEESDDEPDLLIGSAWLSGRDGTDDDE